MNKLLFASSLAALVAACSDSSSRDTSITDDEYDQVAQSVGGSTATGGGGGDVGAMADTAVIATGGLPLGFTVNASGQVVGAHLGVSYSYMLTCKDAQGTVLPACTSLTDSAAASLSWQGSLTLPNVSASVDREGSWSVTGLQTPTATFNGDGSFTYDGMISNIAYHFDDSARYDAVLLDTGSHVATGGEITYDVNANKMVSGQTVRSFSLHAVVDIGADGSATITLDDLHHYTLNLTTGVVVKVD